MFQLSPKHLKLALSCLCLTKGVKGLVRIPCSGWKHANSHKGGWPNNLLSNTMDSTCRTHKSRPYMFEMRWKGPIELEGCPFQKLQPLPCIARWSWSGDPRCACMDVALGWCLSYDVRCNQTYVFYHHLHKLLKPGFNRGSVLYLFHDLSLITPLEGYLLLMGH